MMYHLPAYGTFVLLCVQRDGQQGTSVRGPRSHRVGDERQDDVEGPEQCQQGHQHSRCQAAGERRRQRDSLAKHLAENQVSC